jgi:hypothetical protein
MVVRNIPSITPSRAPGRRATPEAKPDTGRSLSSFSAPTSFRGSVVPNAPVVREPVTSRTGLPSIEETNRLLGRNTSYTNPVEDVEEVPLPGRQPTGPLDFRDSSYNSQIAAIERALRDFETGSATRGQRYQQDFATGLDRLGFRPAPQPMMAMSAMEGEPTGGGVGFATGDVQGEFDIEGEMDRTSAAARGTRGMRDEFAGRGTLRSSDFAKSFDDFQNRLLQQKSAMETGRTRFGEDLSTELAQFQARTQEQRQSAQDAATNRALMRQLSQMGF